MSMTDPIADLLTRIRNGICAGHASVRIPESRVKTQICNVLRHEGYIRDYRVVETGQGNMIEVTLKYLPDRTSVIQGLRRVSRPSLRVYQRCSEIRPVRTGLGVSVMSTPQGVMTGRQARAAHVGGEVLCEVW